MIDLVTGYAFEYTAEQVRPFLRSLRESGYTGEIFLFASGGAEEEAVSWGAHTVPVPAPILHLNADRFFHLREALNWIQFQGALICDTRDVVFQTDPTHRLPSSGLHAFTEDGGQRIGSCPYNSKWMTIGYGKEGLEEFHLNGIVCAGTTCGDRKSISTYLDLMCREIERIQPKVRPPLDQAAHNVIVRKLMAATVWENESAEVYTVGYIPRGTVRIVGNQIVNGEGRAPTIVHQWDRHQNLSKFVELKWL